jgi:predicted PurR-regulated permease PerM
MMHEFRRKTIFVVLACATAVGSMALLWIGRYVLLLVFAACVGALMLSTITDWLQSLCRVPRSFALAFVLGCGVALAILGIWLRGPVLAEQLADIQTDFPAAVHQIHLRLENDALGRWLIKMIAESDKLTGFVSYAVEAVRGAFVLTGTAVAGLLFTAIVGFYLAAEPKFYLDGFRRILPASFRPQIDSCLMDAAQMLKIWLLAKLLSMVIIGVFVAIGLFALRIPLAGTLGTIAGILTFIPNLGPILSVLPAALLAFAIGPVKGMLTISLYCIAHFLEGNLITPLAERKIVTLPPALTFTLQLLLSTFTGILGFALAAPLLAVMLGIIHALRSKRELDPKAC